uniref:Plectin-like isoform X3 n=1 Tax=Petromyzon marinus TaxID=7757 RepID=A0AAJ7T421_PETMA|nr:plectin-like isoform X3 [Petromyzon marinus]
MGNSLGCVDNQELDFDPTKAPLEATSEVVNKTYKGKKKNKSMLKKRLCVSDPEALSKETAIPVDEVSLSTAVLNEFDLLSAQDDGRVKARLSKHSNISSLEEALDAQDEADQGEEQEEEVKEVIKETEVEGVKVTIIERTKNKVSKSSMQDSVSEMDQSQCGELSKDDVSLVSTGGSGLKRVSTSKKTMITTEIVLQEIADVGKSASMSRLEQVPRAKSGDHIAGQIHAISLHSVVDQKNRRGKVDLASAFQTSPTSPTSGPNPEQRRQILGEDGNESPLSDKHSATGVTSTGGVVPIVAERYGSSNADFNGSSVSSLSDPDSGNFEQSVRKLSQMSPAKRRFFDLEPPVNIHPANSTTEGDTLVTQPKGKQERSDGKEDVSPNLSGLSLAMQSKAPLRSMKVHDGELLGESNALVKRAATPNEGHATGNADGWLKEDLAAQDNAGPFEVEMESATPALEARDSSREMVSAGQVGGGTPGRERLLAWARLVAKDVPGLSCHNFSSSWRDGRLLCAIVHAHRPGLVDLEEVRRRGARQNLEEALSLAESELGVPRLLDPEDVDVDAPDEKSIITYVSALHNALHKQDGQSRVALDANEDADEFWRLAASLRVWIEERTITLKSRTFPYSIDKLMVMQKEHALMKNSEFPKKKAELLQLEEVYKSMELSNDGHEACRPDELREAWSGLLNASANYEDAIVTEVQRLEMLQRLAQKMEVDTNTCAEGLNKVYEALQADVALINSGRVPQHGEEISRCLSEIEVFVQSLYPDVRTLTDGGCSQPELLQSRLRRLEEQVASLRAEHAKITAHAGEGARSRSRDEAQLQAASSQQDQTAAAYLQELLTWVQSNQATVDKSGYGKDLDETTALLEEQKALHQTIENFRSSLGEAQETMQSVSQGSRYDYSKSLDKLEQQYSKLLNGSRARLGLLENQQGFLRRCQREMLWLTQREEREVAYDWSDLNPDLEPKKEAYALLVRELEQREPAFREVVQAGEDLVGEGHPGNPTIQAYLLALKTQWSWLLQLCSCVETHLAENTVYFQFFKDARELEQQLRRVQDTVRRRYACDTSTSLARLENLLQDAQEEKEQLSELKVGTSKLLKRAKAVVQLKPRRPEFSPRSPTPVTALCSYHQDQVTLTKHDECSLSGVEDGRWTVSNPSGRSGTVPSVCFLVPAPNKEALDSAARVEQRYQDSVSLWKQLYGKMQGLLLWQHLHADMGIVTAWNIDNFRGLAEQDYLSVMDALESHYGQLEGHNEASQAFSAAEMQQLRGDVAACRARYQQLLEQLVLEERTDEDSEQLLSDLAALSQQLRECQEQLAHGVRTPLDAETAQYVQLCLTAQEGLHREVESLGSEADRVARKCEPVLSQGVASPRLHALRSQLEQLQHSLRQTHSLSLLYRDKLSMLNEVKTSMEETERLLASYEGRLSEESAIPNETDSIDAYRNTVRQWQTEVSQKRRSMRGLEEALDRALTVGERLSRTHGEACVDLARMRDATQALQGRWDSVDAQVDSRVRDLEKLSRILGHYRQSYQTIMQWVQEVGSQQEEPLPTQTADYQELSSQLNQHKELVTEIDRRQDKVNECQRYSEQYCAALKEYEMQLMEYRALVESAHSGPSRHQWQQSEADTIAQEFLDLRGRYTALVNLTGHRVKTISDSLQQLQQQERDQVAGTKITHEIETLQKKIKEENLRHQTEKESLLLKQTMIDEEKARLAKIYEEEISRVRSMAENESQQKMHQLEKNKQLQKQVEESFGEQSGAALERLYEPRSICKKETKITITTLSSCDKSPDLSTEEGLKQSLLNSTANIPSGQFAGKDVTAWELVQSNILSEEQRRKLLSEYRSGKIIIETLILAIAQAIQDGADSQEVVKTVTFRGPVGDISLQELVDSKVLHPSVAKEVEEGKRSADEVSKMIEKYSLTKNSIAGILLENTKEKVCFYDAMKRGLIRADTAFELLEAQVATGYIIDPATACKLTMDAAIQKGLIGAEFREKLLSTEKVASGNPVSLFAAIQRGLVTKHQGLRLLEVQVATGGIVNSQLGLRIPLEDAVPLGLVDEETKRALSESGRVVKGFFDPNTEESVTYQELMQRCMTESHTGLRLLPIKAKVRDRKLSSTSSIRKRRIVIVDPDIGTEMTLYEAYCKDLIDLKSYIELSEQECEWEDVTTTMPDGTTVSVLQDTKSGLKYNINEALARGFIDRANFNLYQAGKISIADFADMLTGSGYRSRCSSTSSDSAPLSPKRSPMPLLPNSPISDPTEEKSLIAGIFDLHSLEKITIREAIGRNLVDVITAQRLYEGQACTGGIISPFTGQKMLIQDAANRGIIDRQMAERIALAQKAHTGFEDPKTGKRMSTAQAMRKGWLYYETGQRFLEAQYLTGGLIEPDTSGRVTMEEALKNGTVDARTVQKLRDVNNYSKCLTCPKTKLRISYKEALDSSVVDPLTGLRLLEASTSSTKGFPSSYSVGDVSPTSGSRASSRRGSFDASGTSHSSSGYSTASINGGRWSLSTPHPF